MSEKEQGDYPLEDRELLMQAAAIVLLATVAADRSGPVAYFEEMTAAGTFLYEARRRYRDNGLVQELFRRQEQGEPDSNRSEHGEITKESLLQQVDRINGLLRRDEEGMEFRHFLFDLAQKVARASRASWFGPRVSPQEAAFLTELQTRLGLDRH